MNIGKRGREWCRALGGLLLPGTCPVCGRAMAEGEEAMCDDCWRQMPRTGYWQWPGNPMELRLLGRMPLVGAAALFYYRRGSGYAGMVKEMKYGGRRDLGVALGRRMAEEMGACGWLREVEVIVPVPLHWRRLWSRGYNQSLALAEGLAREMGMEVGGDWLCRRRRTVHQVGRPGLERWANLEGSICLRRPGGLAGRHVLLLDDVMTTGATLTACADALRGEKGIRLSVMTLAVADG